MKKLSEKDSWDSLRKKVSGLGSHSIKKSYYSELKDKIQGLTLYQELFDQSGDAIILFSFPEGIVEDANKAGAKLFESARNRLIGKKCEELFDTPIAETLKSRIINSEDKNPFPHIETPLRINDKTLHVELRCSRLDFSNTTFAVLVIHDITSEYTERRMNAELRNQLTRAQRMEAIGNLAGGVAHDFNNLILTMSGHADMAKLVADNPEKVSEHLDEILNAAEKAGRLTKQLLTLGRKQSAAQEVINANNIILDISKMLTRLLGNNRHLITNLDDQLWPVEVDPGHFEQIVLNLVINARDAISENGSITISTYNKVLKDKGIYSGDKVNGNYILVSVVDNGTGMDEKTISRIFEPFFTTKDAGKGTGLGLSTVYSLIGQNQGFIEVDSELGVGTQFNVYFKKSEKVITDKTSEYEVEDIEKEKTILIVEDEAMVRKLIYESLRAHDFNVISANDGQDGLEKFEANKDIIDLVITDIRMPNMNGTVLYDNINNTGFKGKFIFISGYLGSDVDKVMQIGEGAQFVQKPFRTSQLVKTVRSALSEKRP